MSHPCFLSLFLRLWLEFKLTALVRALWDHSGRGALRLCLVSSPASRKALKSTPAMLYIPARTS